MPSAGLRHADAIEQCPSPGSGKHMLVLSSSQFGPIAEVCDQAAALLDFFEAFLDACRSAMQPQGPL